MGLGGGIGPAFESKLEGGFGIRHRKSDVVDAGPVELDVIRDGVLGAHCPGDDEADVSLAEEVGSGLPHAGLRPPVADHLEAEDGPQEMRSLEGVAHPPFQIREPLQGEVILGGHLLGPVECLLVDAHLL